MAGTTRTRQQAAREGSRVANPAPGTVLLAPAGGRAEVTLDFENGAPVVMAFHLDVSGLPGGEWYAGAGVAAKQYAPASGGGALTLALTPPAGAALGQYDLRVQIQSEEGPVGNELALVLQVEEGLPSPVEVEKESVPEPLPAPEPLSTPVLEALAPVTTPVRTEVVLSPGASTPGTTPAPSPRDGGGEAATSPPSSSSAAMPARGDGEVAAQPQPVTPQPVVQQPITPQSQVQQQQPVRPVTPQPVTPQPVTPQPAVTQQQQQQSAQPVAQPQPAGRPVAQPQPVAKPQPVVKPQAAVQPQPVAPVRPAPRVEELELVDLPEAEEEEAQQAQVREPNVLDPKDGDTFAVAPGGTMLLRFRITNEGRRERTYVIDEDRSLDSRWINIVTDQIHLMHNGTDELSVRLSAPINAEPGLYPFQVRVGPADGVLTPQHFLLSVTATPAVKITAKQDKVSFGPFSRHADFTLSVESAGNCDTAFRVSVKSPTLAAEAAAAAAAADQTGERAARRGSDDVYETPQWRYLFDRELDNLEAIAPGHPRKPRQVRLRVQRKGIWWLGVRETHVVRVSAVPVTDAANGGKPGNVTEVTALHWRPAPVPAFALAPLGLLLLLLMTGGASGLRVAGPTYEAPDGMNYVVREPANGAVTARLKWDAPWYSLLRLSGKGFSRFARSPEDVSEKLQPGEPSQTDELKLIPLIAPGSSVPSVRVQFIRGRTDTPLLVNGAGMLDDGTYSLSVPSDGSVAKLVLQNGAAQDNRINFWIARRPGPASPYKVLYLLGSGSINPKKTGGSPEIIKVRLAQPGQAAPEDELVLVTTDAKRPLVRVRLTTDGAGGK